MKFLIFPYLILLCLMVVGVFSFIQGIIRHQRNLVLFGILGMAPLIILFVTSFLI